MQHTFLFDLKYFYLLIRLFLIQQIDDESLIDFFRLFKYSYLINNISKFNKDFYLKRYNCVNMLINQRSFFFIDILI